MTLKILIIILAACVIFLLNLRFLSKGYFLNLLIVGCLLTVKVYNYQSLHIILTTVIYVVCPLLLINTTLYSFLTSNSKITTDPKYVVKFETTNGKLKLQNIRRGASVIGAAGSGKTESVVYGFLKHFGRNSFCGIIHDYKNLELTEIAYPLFKEKTDINFYVICFDNIFNRVNPIAPKYLENEESVNEISRVLLDNLLEQKDSFSSGSNKFFYDAAEGLVGGLIWKLKTSYPEFCTIPHLIAIYQNLPNDSLVSFLCSNTISKSMANAFVSGIESEKQTAGVKSTLANALKKICTKNIFYVLSGDEVPLNVNSQENPSVICLVNNPKMRQLTLQL